MDCLLHGNLTSQGKKIEHGGISTFTRYDAQTQFILVGGWYLPAAAYDEILVFADEKFLGKARLYCTRNDVYMNYPQYEEHKSGWMLHEKIDLSLPCKVTVKCLYRGEVVRIDEKVLKSSCSISSRELHHGEAKGDIVHLCPWLPSLKSFRGGQMYAKAGVREKARMLLEHCCNSEEKFLNLASGGLFFYDMHDLHVALDEILIHEDYWFEASCEEPLIIDGGANIGVATYYFKQLYPRARILAFEPNPELVRILEQNVKYNQWTNVTVLPYALGAVEGEATFYVQPSSLAGSLEKRNLVGMENSLISKIPVSVVRLGKYLTGQHVDYLKLDIEGRETQVLEDIESQLEGVDHVFVEFHEGAQKGHNYISNVLSVLEHHGFDVMVRHQKEKKPMRSMQWVGQRVSEEIWAKRHPATDSFICGSQGY